MQGPDVAFYHALWARLHQAADKEDPMFLRRELDRVLTELSQKKNCPCFFDAQSYMLALLDYDWQNLNKTTRRGRKILMTTLHNLINLKLNKKVFYFQ